MCGVRSLPLFARAARPLRPCAAPISPHSGLRSGISTWHPRGYERTYCGTLLILHDKRSELNDSPTTALARSTKVYSVARGTRCVAPCTYTSPTDMRARRAAVHGFNMNAGCNTHNWERPGRTSAATRACAMGHVSTGLPQARVSNLRRARASGRPSVTTLGPDRHAGHRPSGCRGATVPPLTALQSTAGCVLLAKARGRSRVLPATAGFRLQSFPAT